MRLAVRGSVTSVTSYEQAYECRPEGGGPVPRVPVPVPVPDCRYRHRRRITDIDIMNFQYNIINASACLRAALRCRPSELEICTIGYTRIQI